MILVGCVAMFRRLQIPQLTLSPHCTAASLTDITVNPLPTLHCSLTDRQVTRNLTRPGDQLKYSGVAGHLVPVSVNLASLCTDPLSVSFLACFQAYCVLVLFVCLFVCWFVCLFVVCFTSLTARMWNNKLFPLHHYTEAGPRNVAITVHFVLLTCRPSESCNHLG